MTARRVVLFIPDGPDRHRWMDTCTRAVARGGFEVVAVSPTWQGAEQELAGGRADSILVASHEHLPRGRVLVAPDVGEIRPDGHVSIRQRRSRPVTA